ncbi:MAG: response regulator, partial [Candidatus Omnitrophota bacterium]|nr:response regulator [Candidatus Omnitrophota bacterium]
MPDKTRVLICDDDALFAEGLKDLLKEKGYETEAVNAGIDAIRKIKEEPFDVILLDIRMPVMDGVMAYKEIKKINPKIVVIMITAFSEEELIKNALEEGAYGIFYKPLEVDALIKRIDRAKEDGCLFMVVDDDLSVRTSLKDILEEKGYLVNIAGSGEEAIKIAKEKLQEVVFLDMKLPVLNGLETYLILKKINPAIIAVLITGYKEEMQGFIQKAIDNGAYICLYKPVDPERLLGLIKEIAKKRHPTALSSRASEASRAEG